MITQGVQHKAQFDFIRYANCWEDADVLLEAMAVRAQGCYLSIASAGDNTLSLLTRNPAAVIAVDLNPAQLACLSLRQAAFMALDHERLLQFLGIHEGLERQLTYHRLRGLLSREVRIFWDSCPELIRHGVIHSGKFEQYFRMFRRRILPLAHGRRQVQTLLNLEDRESRREFYQRTWNNWPWRVIFKIFFSQWVMGRWGRDPAFFQYVKGDVARKIRHRAEYALTELPTHKNPYLEYILTGNYRRCLPHYLRPENFEAIRSNLHKLIFVQGDIRDVFQQYPDYHFDGMNLSDIFEYMGEEEYGQLMQDICRHMSRGGRLVYWNMLVDRRCPMSLHQNVVPREDLAAVLFERDKAFFYKALVIEEVL
jgi:S-adenosylmethionine-diacylglycerol 3-amino-3-carboxypropyl transferase